MSSRRSRGQATPLWAIVLVLAALLLVPVALLARATIERAEAQNAADAVALAGALEDEDAARAIARQNGARVASYFQDGATVEVTVVVGGRRASARAVRDVVRSGPSATPNRPVTTPP